MTNFVRASGQMLSQEFVNSLLITFPAPDIDKPDFNRDEILWAAAQHQVVKFIIQKCSVKGVSANFDNRAV